MRAVLMCVVGLVVAYLVGGFAVPLSLIRGSAGAVNGALVGR